MSQMKKYETETDIANEQEAGALLRQLGYEVVALGGFSCADFIARKQNTLRLIEFKVRNHQSGKFPNCYIPHTKVQHMLDVARLIGAEPIYIARFEDGYYWCDLRSRYDLEVVARKDRPKDGGFLMACYDLVNFRRVV